MSGSFASTKMYVEIIKKALFPVLIFTILVAAYVFYKTRVELMLPELTERGINRHISAVFVVSIVFIIQRIIGGVCSWYSEIVAPRTQTRLDDELVPLLRKIFKIAIWVMAILIILPIYGMNISALVAALGVSSLAIALAAQDTIANIISGFMIMVDKPFRISDKIKLPSGEIVEVLDIGVRRSKFLSEEKFVIIVPNVDLSKSKIINYTYGKEMTEPDSG